MVHRLQKAVPWGWHQGSKGATPLRTHCHEAPGVASAAWVKSGVVGADGFGRERVRRCSVGTELRFGRTGVDQDAADDSKV